MSAATATLLGLSTEQWTYFAASSTIWTLLYAFSLLFPIPMHNKYRTMKLDEELDVRNRQISLIHGTTVLLCSAYEIATQSAACGKHNSLFEHTVLYISMGYFTYDFFAMAYYGLLDWAMTIHHAACVFGMAMNIASGTSANLMLGGLFIAEVSNPAMHVSTILRRLGMRYTRTFEISELLFMLLYTIGRIILGTFQVYNIVTCADSTLMMKITGVVILVQSYFFTTHMVPVIRDRVAFAGQRARLGVHMSWLQPLDAKVLEKMGIDPNKPEKIIL